MNLIKKLILGSAFIGGAVICGSNSAYATMQPFPVTFLNYQWTNNVKGLKPTSSLTSRTSKISVRMINTATGDQVIAPQEFTYYSDADWKNLTSRVGVNRFQANDYGMLYFRYDMTGITDISQVSANYKLEISVVTSTGNKISGYLSVLDMIRNYYQAGNGFETIANANTEAIQQAADVVTGVNPEDGDIQYGKNGGFTNLHKGADGQVLKLENGMPVWSSAVDLTGANTLGSTANATTIAGDLKFQSTQNNAANTANKAVTTISEPNTTDDYTLTLPTNTGTLVAAGNAPADEQVLSYTNTNGVRWASLSSSTGLPAIISSPTKKTLVVSSNSSNATWENVTTANIPPQLTLGETDNPGSLTIKNTNNYGTTLQTNSSSTLSNTLTLPTNSGTIVAAEAAPTANDNGKVLTVNSTGNPVWSNASTALPTGGTDGKFLTYTNGAAAWGDVPTEIPAAGTTGYVLKKTDTGNEWAAETTELPTGGTNGQVLTQTANGAAWGDAPASHWSTLYDNTANSNYNTISIPSSAVGGPLKITSALAGTAPTANIPAVYKSGLEVESTGNYGAGIKASATGTNGTGVDVSATGTGVNVSATERGVYAETLGASGQAVVALTHGDNSIGVFTETLGESGQAVVAVSHGENSTGVYAETLGEGGTALIAAANAVNGTGVNVSAAGTGVKVNTTGTNGTGLDVSSVGTGVNVSAAGIGVKVNTTGANGTGLYAKSTGANSYGVYAEGGINGITAISKSDDGTAVFADADGANSYGVYTITSGANSASVLAIANGDESTSVEAIANKANAIAVYANNSAGGTALQVKGKTQFVSTSSDKYVNIAMPTNSTDVDLTLPTNSGALVAASTAPTTNDNGKVLTVSANGTPEWTAAPSGLPTGGTAGQVLTQTANGAAWGDAPAAHWSTLYDNTANSNYNTISIPSGAVGGPLTITSALAGTGLGDLKSGLEVSSTGDYGAGIKASATGTNGYGIYAKVTGNGVRGIQVEATGNGARGIHAEATGVDGTAVQAYSPNSIGVSGLSVSGTGIIAASLTGTALKIDGTTKFVSDGILNQGQLYFNNVVIAKPAELASSATEDVTTTVTLPTNSGALVAASTAPTTNDNGKVLTVSATGTPTWGDAPAAHWSALYDNTANSNYNTISIPSGAVGGPLTITSALAGTAPVYTNGQLITPEVYKSGLEVTSTGSIGAGIKASATGDNGRGISANATGVGGNGVYAKATGNGGTAVYAESSSEEGEAIRAKSTGNEGWGIGVEATGEDNYGVHIKANSTGGIGIYAEANDATGIGVVAVSETGTALGVQGTTIFVSDGNNTQGQSYHNNVVIAKPAALASSATADVTTNLTLPSNDGTIVAADPANATDGQVLTMVLDGNDNLIPTWTDAPGGNGISSWSELYTNIENTANNTIDIASGAAGGPLTITSALAGTAPTANTPAVYKSGLEVTSTGDYGEGIKAKATGANGYGVYASASGESGTGVYATAGTNGIGVSAIAQGTNGTGVSASSQGTGVSAFGDSYGVYANTTNGTGVFATATGTNGYGIMARANDATSTGVLAQSENGTALKVGGKTQFTNYLGSISANLAVPTANVDLTLPTNSGALVAAATAPAAADNGKVLKVTDGVPTWTNENPGTSTTLSAENIAAGYRVFTVTGTTAALPTGTSIPAGTVIYIINGNTTDNLSFGNYYTQPGNSGQFVYDGTAWHAITMSLSN